MFQRPLNRLINIHIPKTAGSNFRVQMHRHSKLIGVNLEGDYDDYFVGLRDAARQRIAELASPGLNFMSGHYRYRDVKDIARSLPVEVSFVTFLREPVSRLLSDYFYSISTAHTSQSAFVNQYPTFETYLADGGQINKQLTYLQPAINATVADTFESLENDFAFVGITEHFETHFEELRIALNLPKTPPSHSNTGLKSDERYQVGQQFKDQITDLHRDEIELYDLVCQAWKNKPQALI